MVSGLSVVLVVIFVLSGLGKLTSLRSSARAMHALRLNRWATHPRTVLTTTAVAELLLAAGLVFTRGLLFLVIAAGAWISTIVFLLVAVRAARLGSVEECGCFGDVLPSRVGMSLTRRNLMLVAIASANLGVAAVSLLRGDSPAVVRDSPDAIGVVVVAIAALACGALMAASMSPHTPGTTAEAPRAVAADAEGAVLLGSDGEVVDPVQRALRGRGQLLLFVRPGCSSCDDVAAAARAASSGLVDVRLVTAVGDGNGLAHGGQADGGAPAQRAYADPVGRLAKQLGVPDVRPAAALLTTLGQILRPFAEGREQVLDLITAVAAAVGTGEPTPPKQQPEG